MTLPDTRQFTMQEDLMVGRIINHVPRLLKEQEKSVPDLMYGARLAAGTAYSWADENSQPSSIDTRTLAKLCEFFGVSVGEILEYAPEE